VVLTRNPYKDTAIRKLLREDDDPYAQAEKIADMFVNDRFMQTKEIINPNLALGHFVVSDRYKLSTVTYQAAQGLGVQMLLDKHQGLPIPDITFVIDVPSQIAGVRMKNEKERATEHKFEVDLDFLEKIRQNYFEAQKLLGNEKIVIIDGTQDIESVFRDVIRAFEKHILKKGEKKVRYTDINEVPEHIKKSFDHNCNHNRFYNHYQSYSPCYSSFN
jgi:dTMP kinase